MAVQSLPTDSKQVQLAIKAEVLRLSLLLDEDLEKKGGETNDNGKEKQGKTQ